MTAVRCPEAIARMKFAEALRLLQEVAELDRMKLTEDLRLLQEVADLGNTVCFSWDMGDG